MNHFIFYVISSTEQLGWSVQPQLGVVRFSIHLSITVPIIYDTEMSPVPLFLFLSNFCIFVMYFCRDA